MHDLGLSWCHSSLFYSLERDSDCKQIKRLKEINNDRDERRRMYLENVLYKELDMEVLEGIREGDDIEFLKSITNECLREEK